MRQFLYGQRFFEREFGRRARVFWNPDVFGYNGQLPQLMRGAGIDGFLTQKLSWNRFNPPEHHTFRWVGIDGSAVLAHFPPADTYNAEATVPELRRAARDFKDHALSARSLLVFGWGDGGGGPTAEMLETLARVGDLQGVPAHDDRRSRGVLRACWPTRRDWPEVVGELYLEYHRGTYTTQARTKRASRRAERALHDAELLAAVSDEPWPREELDGAWQTLLLNHFHDILPGSSIGEVHARAERDLAEVEAVGRARCATASLAGEVVNTIGVERREVVVGERRPALRRGAVVRHRAARRGSLRGARRARPATASRSRTSTCARSSAATARCARSSSWRAAARRWPRPATCSSSTRTARPPSRPGTSTRSTSRRARDCPRGHERRGRARRPAARRGRVRAPDRRAQPHAPDRAPRRRVASGSSSTARSTGTRTAAR